MYSNAQEKKVYIIILLSVFIIIYGCSKSKLNDYSDEKYEQKIIDNLWEQTNNIIKFMERPSRLFNVNKRNVALVVVDMQNGFCLPSGCIEIPESRKIINNINKLVDICHKNDIPILWVRMNISSDEKADNGLWPKFQPKSPISKERANPPDVFIDLSYETEIYNKLYLDSKKDYQVPKSRYSAFIPGSSNIGEILSSLNRTQIIFAGIGTNVCVESTARDAMMLNYEVIVVSDATATVDQVMHEVSLMNIKMFFGDVTTTSEILKEIKNDKGNFYGYEKFN